MCHSETTCIGHNNCIPVHFRPFTVVALIQDYCQYWPMPIPYSINCKWQHFSVSPKASRNKRGGGGGGGRAKLPLSPLPQTSLQAGLGQFPALEEFSGFKNKGVFLFGLHFVLLLLLLLPEAFSFSLLHLSYSECRAACWFIIYNNWVIKFLSHTGMAICG